jgi:hypothetical protein
MSQKVNLQETKEMVLNLDKRIKDNVLEVRKVGGD